MNRKNISILTLMTLVIAVLLSACGNEELSPGVEYMPDMYRSPSLEPYAGNSFYADSMEARPPAPGAIARGYLPYGIPNSFEGYEMAGRLLKNPYPSDEQIIAEGKEIYTKFCVQCHGTEGGGDGPTVTAGGHPPPPAYYSATLKELPEGKMFHTITYGKNLMGSHSSQLNVEERWKVIRYVQTLQNPDDEESEETEGEMEEEGDNAEEAEMSSETAMNN